MKKVISFQMLLVLLFLCGCNGSTENNNSRFLLDTVATITADCDDETLNGAFSLCSSFENKLSRTIENSEVYKLNHSDCGIKVSDDTLKIIERSLYYSKISDGKFDITIAPVSMLWDFNNEVIPSRDEISEALKNVDYHSIETYGNTVNLNGKQIDLGSIAKGYIADRVKDYLVEKKVKSAIINLGGNVVVYGKKYNVGIQKPFDNSIIASITLENKSAVTSGIYQRYIKKDGKILHHILDKNTGYGVENDLASVTVFGESSFDCDALSTVLLLLGREEGTKLINTISDTEAVFITRDNRIFLSDGLILEKNTIFYK